MSVKSFPPEPAETPAAPQVPMAVIQRQQDIPNGTKVPITVNGKTVMGIKTGYLPDVDKCLVKYGPHTHRRKIHGFGDASPRVKDLPEPRMQVDVTEGTVSFGDINGFCGIRNL